VAAAPPHRHGRRQYVRAVAGRRAALVKAGTEDAAMVDDSRWDIESAAKAGLETICVITGGWSEQELRDHGAGAVFDSLVELRERLEETPLGRA
jgi:phosphoglycolate phosphatase-like HAD superfamily hydrolase